MVLLFLCKHVDMHIGYDKVRVKVIQPLIILTSCLFKVDETRLGGGQGGRGGQSVGGGGLALRVGGGLSRSSSME